MMISDIDRVFVLATVFSLNLIVLPLVAWLAEFQSGPVFAKGVCVLLEVLFDKAFAIAGVGETFFVVKKRFQDCPPKGWDKRMIAHAIIKTNEKQQSRKYFSCFEPKSTCIFTIMQ